MRKTLEERFFEKTERADNGCLEWQKTLDKKGYGQFNLKGTKGAHRVAWFIHYGEWPTLFVLHNCDNPKCVEITHLREGTNSDNMLDRSARGRDNSPRKGPPPKLSHEMVKEIKELLRAGVSERGIAAQYGVASNTVRNIKTGKTFRYV